MSLFDPRCPICDSNEWKSVERDENNVNRVIACLHCGTRRTRKQEPPLQMICPRCGLDSMHDKKMPQSSHIYRECNNCGKVRTKKAPTGVRTDNRKTEARRVNYPKRKYFREDYGFNLWD